jgi:hypothetical protein
MMFAKLNDRGEASMLRLVTIAGLLCSVSTIAIAQSSPALNIADNDSVYIDGKDFRLIPGKAKGDVSAEIKKLDTRPLASAIVFRSGNTLYIADMPAADSVTSPPPSGSDNGPSYANSTADRGAAYQGPLNSYGPSYANNTADRNAAYQGPLNSYGPSYANNTADRNAAYQGPLNSYGPSYANNTADRNGTYQGPLNSYGPHYANGVDGSGRTITYSNGVVVPNPADRFAVWANDPDYVRYRLKKEFDDHWTAK